MGFAALYPSCEDYCNRGLWLFGEPGLGKVLIERIRRADPKPSHHYKRDAIGERGAQGQALKYRFLKCNLMQGFYRCAVNS
jgi:hypothetical protein